MTSPGGTEVGRASIRVLPDVSGFRNRLRAELAQIQGLDVTVNVNFDVDPVELQRQLRALDNKIIVRARIIADDPNIDQTVSIRALLNIDLAHWRAQVARINPVRLRANVDVDINEAEIARRVRRAIRNGSADVDVNGRGGGDALGGVTNSFQLLANFGGRWVRYLLQAFAIAPLLAIAGAGITEAWGAASAAIAAIPAALFTIGLPLATVALGFEAIKEEFSRLTEFLDRIRVKVSTVFSQFLPASVSNLQLLLSNLGLPFQKIALSLSLVAFNVTSLLAKNDKIAQLHEIFSLVANTVYRLGDALTVILDTLIDVATISDGYGVLVDPINEFAKAFRASVSEVGNNGVLGGALQELTILLNALARAFVDLVENGLYLFQNSAPGVTALIDALTGFFARFDWSALGAATGAVFQGLADALNAVPKETIDDITLSFQELGGLFQDKRFQGFLVDIIGYLPIVIDLVKIMTEGFIRAIVVVGGLAKATYAAVAIVADSAVAIADGWSFEEFKARNDANWALLGKGMEEAFEAAFAPINEEIPKQFGMSGDNIYHGFLRMDGSIKEGIQLVEGDKDFDPLQGLGEGLGGGIKLPFEEAGQNALIGKNNLIRNMTVTGGELTSINDNYNGLWGVVKVPQGIVTDVVNNARAMADQIVQNVQPPAGSTETVGGAWSAVVNGIGSFTQTAVDNVKNVLSNGFGIAIGVTEQRAGQIPPAAGRGMSGMGSIVQQAMQPVNSNIQAGWSSAFVSTDIGANRVVNRTGQVPGQIQRSMGSGAGILNSAGQNIMNSLYNGLVAAYGRVQNFISNIAGWIARNKGPESVDRRLLVPAGQWIMQGLEEGLTQGFQGVMMQVQQMNSALQDSWTVDGGLFAASLTEGVPQAIASNERLLAKSNVGMTGDLNAAVSAEGFGVGGEIATALEGWQVVIDANGITKLVNKTNTRKARR